MRGLPVIASRTILTPDGKADVMYRVGDTEDIIKVILEADSKAAKDTAAFASSFAPSYAGLRKLWNFVHDNIKYIEDKPGHERIKSPAVTWQDRYGDCKSMSVFIGSVLNNLGIPYNYRFVGYKKGNDVSHVYVVAYLGNREVILDAVHHRFDEEVSYTHGCEYSIQDGKAVKLENCKINGTNHQTSTSWWSTAALIIGAFLILRRA